MGSKQLILLKVAGLCGVLAPIIAYACIGVAISLSPWFSWTENYLSDLAGMVGETPLWAARGTASVIYNVGLTIAGIMHIVFAIGIRKSRMLNTRLGRLGTSFLFLAMCALFAVGIFPEPTGLLHGLAAYTFFFSVPSFLLPIGTVARKSSEKTLGWFTTLLGAISLCSLPILFIPRPWGGNAIANMFQSVSQSSFEIVFGIKLLKQASKVPQKMGLV